MSPRAGSNSRLQCETTLLRQEHALYGGVLRLLRFSLLGGVLLLPRRPLVDLVQVCRHVEENARVRAPPDVVSAEDAPPISVRGDDVREVVVAEPKVDLIEELVADRRDEPGGLRERSRVRIAVHGLRARAGVDAADLRRLVLPLV